MKKMNLLKPDLKCGYLGNGKGQEVKYLNIDPDIGEKELNSDVDGGAAQFKSLKEFIEKKPSRFNVIFCYKEEDGMMAVSYLASIYNEKEGVEPDDTEEGYDINESQDISFEDFTEQEDPFDSDDEGDYETDQWTETPWKIPVITALQLTNDGFNPHISPFYSGGFGYGGIMNTKHTDPYWINLMQESLCFICNMKEIYSDTMVEILNERLMKYSNNRHVYLIVVADDTLIYHDEDYIKTIRGQFCEIVLDHAAGTLNIFASQSEYKKYYRNIFINWVTRKGYRLEKGFPVSRMTESITSMNNPNKSALMEKVIQYTVKDREEHERTLKEADFGILRQFDMLGLSLSDKKYKSIRKMKDELVGMEKVKEQITGIVEVLKYNKRRTAMGLPAGSYHNVHMMIGAPGTAKTTVAELLGNMMADEHLLCGRRFISVNGAELKGMYVGHSAPKVKALFDSYDIIFIDEAYAICSKDEGKSDSFSQEAIAQLIVELEKHGMDRLVMFAGYGGTNVSAKDNRMKDFLNANPGIRSRINTTIYFDSYTPNEMVEIFRCHAKIGKYNLSRKVDDIVRKYFEERVKSTDFGNGREARSLLENSMKEAAIRLSKLSDDQITTRMLQEIKPEDVEIAVRRTREGHTMQSGKKTRTYGFEV